MDKHLHIVCFAVPYPVVYGGLFDLYYKLIALHGAGIKIHLHCFTENDMRHQELDKYCASTHYYPRKKGVRGLSFTLPYIVSSRSSEKLKQNLLGDDYPVLLEGVHCTGLLDDHAFVSRRIILRLHNVEYEYYHKLSLHSSSLYKKIYYLLESKLLRTYESRIAGRPDLILTVSENDKQIYETQFGADNVQFLPVFTGYNKVNVEPGTGCFCLYHGNLSVAENEKAVIWLLSEVFKNLKIPLIIAGKNPSGRLLKIVKQLDHANIVPNPSFAEMQDLVKKAQCHILPSFNSTGVKLKLINALYNGRHCIVNSVGAAGSGMEVLCETANSPEAFHEAIGRLFTQPLTSNDILYRSQVLGKLFDNKKNAEWLIRKLW